MAAVQGQQRQLTKMQKAYLEDIIRMGRLQQGWGGRSSTLTVRILEELGLIRLHVWPSTTGADRWSASPLVQDVPTALERGQGSWKVVC